MTRAEQIESAAHCLAQAQRYLCEPVNLTMAVLHTKRALEALNTDKIGVEWRDPYSDEKLRPGLGAPLRG